MLKIKFLVIGFYIAERLLELVVNARNKKLLQKDHVLKVLNPSESLQMKLFHISWFIMLIIETSLGKDGTQDAFFYTIASILVVAQTLRWIAIFTLGKYWSVDVYEMKGHVVIRTGIYKYIRHPNYIVVVMEFLFIPILLGCPFTLVAGSLGNLLILKRRIKMEERALELRI